MSLAGLIGMFTRDPVKPTQKQLDELTLHQQAIAQEAVANVITKQKKGQAKNDKSKSDPNNVFND